MSGPKTTDTVKQIRYLADALKSPRSPRPRPRLADLARDARWSFEDYLAAVLEREVGAGNASGAELRIRAAGFPAGKMLEDSDWDTQPTIRQQLAQLASSRFLLEARNVVPLGPPGTGKTHLATALGMVAARHGRRALFATTTDWVTRPTDARRQGRLPQELARLRREGWSCRRGRSPSLRARRCELFFQLVSSRYEHASLILTPILPCSGWGSVYGDRAVAAAMSDGIVNHADALSLKGARHRLRGRRSDQSADSWTNPSAVVGLSGMGLDVKAVRRADVIDDSTTVPRLGSSVSILGAVRLEPRHPSRVLELFVACAPTIGAAERMWEAGRLGSAPTRGTRVRTSWSIPFGSHTPGDRWPLRDSRRRSAVSETFGSRERQPNASTGTSRYPVD